MQDGKGVQIKKLGAFCFEVDTGKVPPAQFFNYDVNKPLQEQRDERKHVHSIRPCFVPDKVLQGALYRYHGKEEVSKPKSQHSIYQKGFGMIFCNPVPISQACYLGKEVVKSALECFVQATIDLTNLNKTLLLDFSFVKIQITNGDLKYDYCQSFANNLNKKEFESKMRQSDTPTADHWGTSYESKWKASSMSKILKPANANKAQESMEKTLALKIMSLDFNTAEATNYSKARGSTLK